MTLFDILQALKTGVAPNCRCTLSIPQESRTAMKYNEIGLKFAARMLLDDKRNELIVPSGEEWVGLNLLERDGEL